MIPLHRDAHRSAIGPLTPAALAGLLAAATLASSVRGEPATPTLSKAAAPAGAGQPASYAETIPGTDVRFEMVAIPAGSVKLGSPDGEPGRAANEGPQVEVAVPALWMGKCEVTWGEYHEFMRLCEVFEKFDDHELRRITADNEIDAITAPSKLYEPSFTYASGKEPNLPAVTMSQYAAKQYTKWLSLLTGHFYRLPTEAEWEYACRAGADAAYSFGDDADALGEHAWYVGNSDDACHPVGQKQPNAWGLHDMHGNASEWVLDGYRSRWYGQLQDGVAADAAVCWPDKLYPRVLRGGSWRLEPADCRSAARRKSSDDDWRSYDPNSPKSPWWFASEDAQDVGFRIVRPVAVPPREEREKFWRADLEAIQRVVNFRIDKEGRGRRGVVDAELPRAIQALQGDAKKPATNKSQ